MKIALLLVALTAASNSECLADQTNYSSGIAVVSGPPTESELRSCHWGRTSEGLRLSVETSKTLFLTGETVTTTIRLWNTTGHGVRLPSTVPLRDFRISVTDSMGKSVDMTDIAKREQMFLGVANDGLGGTERRQFDVHLDKLFEMGAPGKYTIVVKRWVPKADRTGFVEVVSNAVDIDIREK